MENTPELRDFITSLFVQQSKREKKEKLERYRHLNQFVIPGQILFVGSSLMEQFPINELLMDQALPLTVYNRGIGGFTTAELAEVLDVCVYDLQPKHIFINIGTNDLNDADYTVAGLIGRYEKILKDIQAHLPESKLYLLAYYPVNGIVGSRDSFMGEIFKQRTNQRILEANEAVCQLAVKLGAEYLDLNDDLKDNAGNLKEEYTVEGMHMYANGYMTVLNRMLPILHSISNNQA